MFGTSTAGSSTHGSSSLSQPLFSQAVSLSSGLCNFLGCPWGHCTPSHLPSCFQFLSACRFPFLNPQLDPLSKHPPAPHALCSFPSPRCPIPKPPSSSRPAALPPRSPSTFPAAPDRHRAVAQDSPYTLGRQTCLVSSQKVNRNWCRAARPARGSRSGALARPWSEQPGLAAEKQVLQRLPGAPRAFGVSFPSLSHCVPRTRHSSGGFWHWTSLGASHWAVCSHRRSPCARRPVLAYRARCAQPCTAPCLVPPRAAHSRVHCRAFPSCWGIWEALPSPVPRRWLQHVPSEGRRWSRHN